MTDSVGEWFTYQQAAEKLSMSAEAVRRRASRGQWQRTIGNDKRIRVRLPEGWQDNIRKLNGSTPPLASKLEGRGAVRRLVRALEDHVATLKSQLLTAEKRVEIQASEFALREARHLADLAVERTLANQMSFRVDQITAELATEQARRVRLEQELAKRPWWKPRRR